MAVLEARGHLVQLVFGAMAAQAVHTAAQLRLADLLADLDRTGAELAEQIGADAAALTRLLRALAALGLVSESVPGAFRLTDSGQLLRTDHPESMSALVQLFGGATTLAPWRELETAVRTGETTFEKVYGSSAFEYLAAHPELSAQFNAAMRQGTALTAQQLPGFYDFARFHTVADIGGGDGTLLAAVLRAHPALRGILFDTQSGQAEARHTLSAAGVADRCELRPGDFFVAVPDGADLYLIKSVIHDWDDDRATTILRHIRRVIPPHGRLLIIEPVLPDVVDGTVPYTMYLSDLNMLVNTGGRERTRTEFERLCGAVSFRLESVTALPTPSGFSLLEARPV
jgi:SAM-dependent methyltransferase/DNA-binding MarR family transcriptional regulator